MNLPPDIAIIDLLRQREAEFVLVWQCEQKIKQLLGNADYPMSMPVELPSQTKPRRKSRRKTATATKVTGKTTPEQTCRKLHPDQENAYRIAYRKLGVEEVSFQTDHELITTLLQLQGQDFQVLKLQTVKFQGLDNWQIVDTLIK